MKPRIVVRRIDTGEYRTGRSAEWAGWTKKLQLARVFRSKGTAQGQEYWLRDVPVEYLPVRIELEEV